MIFLDIKIFGDKQKKPTDVSAAFARATLVLTLLKVKRFAIIVYLKIKLNMPAENPLNIEKTVDSALENCAQRLEALKPLSKYPKNQLIITTVVLGTTAKNLHEAVQNQEAGLNETITKRWENLDFPAEIAARVQAITGQKSDLDPRLGKGSRPQINLAPEIETQHHLAVFLMQMVAELNAEPNAKTLLANIEKLKDFLSKITDATLRTTLEMHVLHPLEALLTPDVFDPLDQRTKLQNIAPLAVALTPEEIDFLDSVASSQQSKLAQEAQVILAQRSTTDGLE